MISELVKFINITREIELKIGIDIDGVIAKFMKDFEPYAETKGIKVIDKFEYPIFKRLSVADQATGLDLLAWFILDNGYAKLQPDKEAIKFLNSLDGEKFVITSRYPIIDKWDRVIKQKIVEQTKEWLKEHGLKYDKLIFTKDKLKHVEQNGIQIFFEDFFNNAEKIGGAAQSFLITRDWNIKQKPNNSIRIDNIKDAAKYIEHAQKGD